MNNYPVGDYLIRIKNAQMAKKREVKVENSKLIESVAKTLKELGYLEKVSKKQGVLTSTLVYKSREPILTNIKVISKPGLRDFRSVDELEKHRKPSVFIVSTSQGVMSSKVAIKKRIGGEVIAEIL